MVETICPSCGNRKSFEDSYAGKTFKCPSCSNPVTIQNVGSHLNTEPVSQTNSFADEIARAELEKKRQDEAARKKARIKANEQKIKNYLIYSIVLLVFSFGAFGAYSDNHDPAQIGLGLGSIIGAIYFYIKRNKLKNGEI